MITDPMELMIAEALDAAGISYVHEASNPSKLDFKLLDIGVEIEVKQFHSDRIAKQMARVDNVIVAQGRGAVELLALLIRGQGAGGVSKSED